MSVYVAFLRGINVGGNNLIRMEALKKAFESAGYKNVKTVLASGNVVFEGDEPAGEIGNKMEKKLEATFGYSIGVTVRTMEELKKLVKLEPFEGVDVTRETRLYVTFLAGKGKGEVVLPYVSPAGDFRILRQSGREVFSVAVLVPGGGTVKAMGILEKAFGKKITTRNWNTVQRILKK